MPTDVRCLVETDGPVTVLRLTGALTPTAADTVRDILLTRLADRPGPVLVDPTGLREGVPVVGRVVAEVGREVADWPAADLVLLDTAGLTNPGSAGPGRAGPAGPTGPGGMPPPVEPGLAPVAEVELAPVVGAAREARELVTTSCRRWGLPELAEPGCIAVTELVNNAVTHARTGMRIRLAPRSTALHLAVRDHSRRPPTFAGLAAPTATGGRGLLLIDTVARRWGSTGVPGGKVVWCVLYVEDETAFRH